MPRFIDITGKRVGRLTVIKKTKTRITPGGQRKTYWLCKCDCGKEKEIYGYHLRTSKTKSCGCFVHDSLCYGDNKELKGGYRNKASGYEYVRINGKLTLKHRVIMEQAIGRKLKHEEIVHHLNGVRHDNRIDNLVITTKGSHQHHTLAKALRNRIRDLEAKLNQKKLL